ncbi:uncharacterized protein K444DRAFT_613615 [Hyaloscypha bicolor E]|uniref:Secreted protein n=1 Tax=Hyaloscypha bicolor E TaxID=1095630 RepID=A0A2J6T6Z9_9HELO|nr:uncharacterized protein K444DRAFT_613615 [Hyaloscypha bicolor E]PMD58795.1 hypothetical protein K444DRAFT_613615 [Hyaloscypha bicolor E]
MKSSLFLGSAFTSIVLADVCNRDNVLRCLVASSADQKCHRHSSDFNLNSYLTHFDCRLNHPVNHYDHHRNRTSSHHHLYRCFWRLAQVHSLLQRQRLHREQQQPR